MREIKTNKINFFRHKILIIIFVFFPTISFAQIEENSIIQDSILKTKSNYSLGLSIGYTGLLTSTKSYLTSDVSGTSVVNGPGFGVIFEYKISGTRASIQFLSETNYLNFKSNNNDNFEIISFNTIGIKVYPLKMMFYITPSIGILTGRETQLIKSFSIGHDFITNKTGTYFIQLGIALTDNNDGFFLFRFGVIAVL